MVISQFMWNSQTVAKSVNHEFEEYCILKSSPAVSELKCMNTKKDYKQLKYKETLKSVLEFCLFNRKNQSQFGRHVGFLEGEP